jgi:N-acetyltransferase
MKRPEPVTMETPRTKVVPLSPNHAPDLFRVGAEEEIWTYLSGEPFAIQADAEAYIAAVLEARQQQSRIAFAVLDRESGLVVGTTSYYDIRLEHAALEIGHTWYSRAARRTHINTETKFLLLRHAFEELLANRVQFLTDTRNLRSQQAIQRIGAKSEGVLRAHKTYPNGYVRDSAVFSIISSEWPVVASHLRETMDGGAGTGTRS